MLRTDTTTAITAPELARLVVDLTRDLSDANARVASLEEDVESYRLVANQAIHYAHGLQQENRQLRRQNEALRDELRRLRGTDWRRAA